MNRVERYAQDIWNNQKMIMKLASEPRAGFYECGMMLSPEQLIRYLPIDIETLAKLSTEERERYREFLERIMRDESVGEHSGQSANLVSEVLMRFPLLARRYSPLIIIKVAQIHDVAESILHDISDNGTAEHEAKREKELEIVSAYAGRLPQPYDSNVRKLFIEMDEYNTPEGMLLKTADKLDAVLRLLECESVGLYGNVYARECPSDMDYEHARIVGTGNCTDVWAYHMYSVTKDFRKEVTRPFYDILYAATMDVRGKFFKWWQI